MTTTTRSAATTRGDSVLLGIAIALVVATVSTLLTLNAPGGAGADLAVEINAAGLTALAGAVIVVGIICALVTCRGITASENRAIPAIALALSSASVGAMAAVLPGLFRL